MTTFDRFASANPPGTTQQQEIKHSLIVGMIGALVWIGGVGSLVAVLLGHRALKLMRDDPQDGKHTVAIVQIVVGYIGLVAAVLPWLVFLWLAPFSLFNLFTSLL